MPVPCYPTPASASSRSSSTTSTRSSTSSSPTGRAARLPGFIRLVHPFPSSLNAALVLGIALVAGGSVGQALVLAGAMLGLQFCIGTVNDLFDEALDSVAKPWKPIPAGLVTRRQAWMLALASAGAGALLALVARGLDPWLLAMFGVMLGAGLVYDAWLKPTPMSWACFAIALPILPVYAWYGATGAMPPRVEVLLPVAALAGPALHIANGLVDYETDAAAGIRNLPVLLGRRAAVAAMALLMAVIHVLAWATVGNTAPDVARGVIAAATGLAVVGVLLSGGRAGSGRGLGWSLQAGSIALLGLGWLLTAAAA